MAAASPLTNLAARLGTVAGPVAIGAAWAFTVGLPGQTAAGILMIDALAVLTLLSMSIPSRMSHSFTAERR